MPDLILNLSIYLSFFSIQGVSRNATPADNPAWFPTAKLNWAENMLRRRDDKVALIQASESLPPFFGPRHVKEKKTFC